MCRVESGPKRFLFSVLLLALFLLPSCNGEGENGLPDKESGRAEGEASPTTSPLPPSNPSNPRVLLKTSMGRIVLELFPEKAPVTVENFLSYVEAGFYDATLFHRVIRSFMIQGGGWTENWDRKQPTRPPIRNEADNGLRNVRGTIAMARQAAASSATCQFFINVADNPQLDHRGLSDREFGYAVFGRVEEGMDTVDRIRRVETTTRGDQKDVPASPVTLFEARRLSREP